MRLVLVLAVAIAGLGAPALDAAAQAPGGSPRVGYLDASGLPRWFEAFQLGMADLGYVEGRNLVIDRRSIAGQAERLPDTVADLVRAAPHVIVASGSRPSLAAKGATATIPIVMAFATDPVGLGLVASLARPGGNVTGLSSLGAGLMGKRLELLSELEPGLARVGVVWSPSVRDQELDYRELQAAAAALRLALASFEVARPEDYDGAFRDARAQVGVVAVLSGPMAFANRERIVAAAARHRVRAIYYDVEYARAGGLMSYGPGLVALHRRAAVFVDKILKGAKPADLPVEEPTRFELVVNARTARELGILFPPAILARADDVIE